MRNKTALFAMLAIAVLLSSCGNDNDLANFATSPRIVQQTPVSTVVFHGTVSGTFLDHQMIPVNFQGQPIWAFCSDANYQMAVAIGQAQDSGKIVHVTMVASWHWFRDRFEITKYSVVSPQPTIPVQPVIPTPVKRPYRKNPQVIARPNTPCPNIVTQPCNPCGCGVTINGPINAPVSINTGNGTSITSDGTKDGAATTPRAQCPPQELFQPRTKVRESENFLRNPEVIQKKKRSKSEPWTFPWN